MQAGGSPSSRAPTGAAARSETPPPVSRAVRPIRLSGRTRPRGLVRQRKTSPAGRQDLRQRRYARISARFRTDVLYLVHVAQLLPVFRVIAMCGAGPASRRGWPAITTHSRIVRAVEAGSAHHTAAWA